MVDRALKQSHSYVLPSLRDLTYGLATPVHTGDGWAGEKMRLVSSYAAALPSGTCVLARRGWVGEIKPV